MTLLIAPAVPADAEALGPLQLRVWLETYPCREAGIDETWIREVQAPAAGEAGVGRWRQFIEVAAREPDRGFCRVVRSGTQIVGFLCGLREEEVTLGPMYLLNDVQGRGLGDRLMGEFLAWAGNVPMRLWVTEYNDRAIRFYERYGFKATGERKLWRGRLPNTRMTRPAKPPER